MTIKCKTIEERFFEKIEKINSCWIWKSTITPTGYGHFSTGGTNQRELAHRFSYELHKGKIPERLVVDHLCRNRSCVNPDHLQIVTQQENVLRGIGAAAINARKTHCVKGHSFEEMAYVNHKGQRICNECKRIATRIRRLKYPELMKTVYNPIKRKEVHRRDWYKIKTHCKHGHEFTKENTLWFNNRRKCASCRMKSII